MLNIVGAMLRLPFCPSRSMHKRRFVEPEDAETPLGDSTRAIATMLTRYRIVGESQKSALAATSAFHPEPTFRQPSGDELLPTADVHVSSTVERKGMGETS
jgi:hypothetical protein